jgi:hypothetical protein
VLAFRISEAVILAKAGIQFRNTGFRVEPGMTNKEMLEAWQRAVGKERKEVVMAMMTIYHPVLSLAAGILILIFPRLLNYIVAIYLIIAGVVGLIH